MENPTVNKWKKTVPCFIKCLIEHFIQRIRESLANRVSIISHDLTNFKKFVAVAFFFVSLKKFLRRQMWFHPFNQFQDSDEAQTIFIFFSGWSWKLGNIEKLCKIRILANFGIKSFFRNCNEKEIIYYL